jgi:SAM-dependent MidA family methyltransferase
LQATRESWSFASRYVKAGAVTFMSGHPLLIEIIRDEIRRHGPVSFSRFMRQALYHPEFGYYTSDRKRIGRKGDFCTNVSVGPLFGQILMQQIQEMALALGSPDRFVILEQGAEDGQLASDILDTIERTGGSSASHFEYVIVEPFSANRDKQKQLLREKKTPVSWAHDLAQVPAFTGLILTNELLDSFPVRLVEFDGSRWDELFVALDVDRFVFSPRPIRDERLNRYLTKIPTPAIAPYRTEVNLAALDWIRSAATVLQSGFLLTVDYGFNRNEYYAPLRAEGTLTCYSKQQRFKNPLTNVGECDITAHVDFTSLAEIATEAGLCLLGFADQHHFMVGAAEARLRGIEAEVKRSGPSKAEADFLRAYRTLMHPAQMGLAFKFLVLSKNVKVEGALSGFRYAGDPGRALGWH